MDIRCIFTFVLMINKVTSTDPVFEITPSDIFENRRSSMVCRALMSPCNPENVTIQKKVNDKWYDACVLFDDLSSVPIRLPDGHSVEGRVEVIYFDQLQEFIMNLLDAEINDNGDWRCKVGNCPSEELESQHETLLVSTILEPKDIVITPPDFILLNSTAEYTCYSSRVYPQVNVTWKQGDERIPGIPIFNCVDYICEITSTQSFTFCDPDKMTVTCILEKTSASNPWFRNNTADPVLVYAPANIEAEKISDKNPNISDTLTITCTGSGTNHILTWTKDDEDLPDDLFEKKEELFVERLPCGETNTTQSTITWKRKSDLTCGIVVEHDGKYQCHVNADKETTDSSQILEMNAYYPPIVLSAMEDIPSSVGKSETLSCEIECAMPNILSYEWKRHNDPEDLGYNTSSITIKITVEDINNTFICRVTNEVGFNSMIFNIRQEELPVTTTTKQPPSTTTPSYNESTTNPGEPEDTNQALVTAFAVIWSLCGVFAILLVCLALYHYRQIQNGRKYKGEYSEELVLTEDEAQPGTSHGSGVYDDISPAVVCKGSESGAIGGVTNEGLYAEVQRPAQTQMPVAPKRTSKIQASQPNPGTPKTKRAETPAAPKSPMDARHQPNSPSSDRRPEPKADYSPVSNKKEMPPKHSHDSNHVTVSKVVQNKKRHEAPTKPAPVKQNTNGTKPSVPVKPDIQSFRSSRSSGIIPAGAPYYNAEVNLYANCDQRPEPKNGDGTITYADQALQQEDPYEEGAPPVPKKNMADQEPVQYASIKRNK